MLHTLSHTYNGYSTNVRFNFDYQALSDNYFQFTNSTQPNNSGGFNMYGNTGEQTLPITLVLTTKYNGCRSPQRVVNYATLNIFPRGIGGEIIDPLCPLVVENNDSVYTTGFDTATGDAVNGYIWQYSTTGNEPWTTIGGQGAISLPLWTMEVLGIERMYYIRRVAKHGGNCGGDESSNIIKIETPDVMVTPKFSLPSIICKQNGFQLLPTTSSNGIVGTWHTFQVSISNGISTPSISAPINPSQFSTATAGTFKFIFIPSTTNAVCSDFLIYEVKIYDYITPNPPVANSYCETQQAFSLPLISTNNPAAAILWEVLNENTGNYVAVSAWNTNLYVLYDNPTHANGKEILTFRIALNTNTTVPNYYPCGNIATKNIQLKRKVKFSIPSPISYCVGQTTGLLSLPTQVNIINGKWRIGNTIVTSINTATVGTFVYTYSGDNTCEPYTFTVIIKPNTIVPTFDLPANTCVGVPAP